MIFFVSSNKVFINEIMESFEVFGETFSMLIVTESVSPFFSNDNDFVTDLQVFSSTTLTPFAGFRLNQVNIPSTH